MTIYKLLDINTIVLWLSLTRFTQRVGSSKGIGSQEYQEDGVENQVKDVDEHWHGCFPPHQRFYQRVS